MAWQRKGYPDGKFQKGAFLGHPVFRVFQPNKFAFNIFCIIFFLHTELLQVEVTYFPFDDQTCNLKLSSWMYDGSKVGIGIVGDDLLFGDPSLT